jgi:hypothetical protein
MYLDFYSKSLHAAMDTAKPWDPLVFSKRVIIEQEEHHKILNEIM